MALYNKQYHNQIKFIVFIITVILLVSIGNYFHVDKVALQKALGRFSFLSAGIIFILLYSVVTFFIWLSKDAFRFAAAFLFGPYISTLLVYIAETINAVVLFYFARYMGRNYTEEALRDRYRKLDDRLGNISFLWLFIFRSVPLIPFRFLDLAAGITKISFKRYLLAVILGSPLRIFWLQYAMAVAGEAIFNNPKVLTGLMLEHKPLYLLSLVYIVFAIAVILKLRKRS